ncbi:MAG: type II toxin-antitoxin system PemK/MazF family toxin [Deltaproteobacteria bacterium]|nr:type II toxin-antitoxin system PemK/MazF family toxin [Deltaproteobacteria bacterium]
MADLLWNRWPKCSGTSGRFKRNIHPGLVIQNNALNDSRINTVIMLALTSNLRFSELPGNVTLRKGEVNMPKSCIINFTQISR